MRWCLNKYILLQHVTLQLRLNVREHDVGLQRASRRAIFLATVAVYAVVISKHLLGSATMPGMFQRPDGPCSFARKDAPLILFAIPRRLTSPRRRAGSCVKITHTICWQLWAPCFPQRAGSRVQQLHTHTICWQLWTPCVYFGQSLGVKLSGSKHRLPCAVPIFWTMPGRQARVGKNTRQQ